MVRLIFFFVFKIILYFLIISVAWVLVLKVVPVWVTPHMIGRKIEASRNNQQTKIYHDWESYDNISREVALAVVAAEDQNFPTHWGFDFEAMKDALSEDRERTRGASTISQQVAKNVFLWHGRSYFRKALEAYFTLLIELIWGKKRILEVYLNVAEMGRMTFGAEAASLRFYGKPAKNLSRAEAARMAAVLPNPNRFSIKNPSSYVQGRAAKIARQMRALGGQKYLSGL
jgi:monofunctional glycosyltransferase